MAGESEEVTAVRSREGPRLLLHRVRFVCGNACAMAEAMDFLCPKLEREQETKNPDIKMLEGSKLHFCWAMKPLGLSVLSVIVCLLMHVILARCCLLTSYAVFML